MSKEEQRRNSNTEDEIITTTKKELIKLVKEMSMINVSAIMEKFKDMENSIEAKIDKTIAENYSATAVNIIETVKEQEKQERKKIYDKRLRNAKYLFRNYNNLVNHYKNAVYIESELEDDNLKDMKKEKI